MVELRPALRDKIKRLMEKGVNFPNPLTIDIGDDGNVHANNKWEVGWRLSLAALHDVYGRDIVSSGPLFRSMRRERNTVRLTFDHADGLTLMRSSPTGFTVAGADRVFHDAVARIEKGEVVVSSPAVPDPVAVRYGWEDCPPCTLFNTAGLPASPFRTDSWPGVTEGRLQQH